MTTNQTIDGVPRQAIQDACYLIEQIWEKLQLHSSTQDNCYTIDELIEKGQLTELARLRDLLDAKPAEVTGDIKLHLNISNVKVTVNPDGSYSVGPGEQPQGEPVAIGYVLAKQTAVEVPGQVRKELGYTLLDGIGIFHSADEVHAAIAELGLSLGWVSMTVDQLLPGYMAPAVAEQPAPAAVVLPDPVTPTEFGDESMANGWNACLDEATRLNTKE